MANDYKQTMNLPKTDFPMRAGLPKSEPVRLEAWENRKLYEEVLKANEGNESFVLHDGPPYANGPIHIGHAFNKILKDFCIKSKSQMGYYTPYTPGWDCHGQPIEHMVEEKLGPEKMAKIDTPTLRRLCREWAEKYVGIQRDGFRRLGVRGDWQHPYLTYVPSYEAGNVKIFKDMYEKGAIYRGRKPIHWCKHCHTALAEAEIEYGDETSPSIYVKFDMVDVPAPFAAALDEGVPVKVVIWTTTPWTLPANSAVCLAPDADYVVVLHEGEALIMAEALVEAVASIASWEGEQELLCDATGEPVRVKGADMLKMEYKCPIFPETHGIVILGDYVELSTGTGAVHTAPGHGQDDYLSGIKYGARLLMPVDDNGVFTEGGGPFEGMNVDDANPVIIDWLRERGALVAKVELTHSYPHCWRCHEPVIFRATDQWFVSMDETQLRDKALVAIDEVTWYPGWSSNRIRAMVADRPDWCISRQRSWGVPIPVFKCKDCNETVATPETFDAVIKLFESKGADAWFTEAPSDYLPAGTKCASCGCTEILPEKDILDVWWESGVSHTSVCDNDEFPLLHRPAEMYLEGSDQHRGWFQSSLLTSVGTYGIAPFESVLSCGFVVDGEGRKMSKSLGNGVDPADVIAKSGADVLRLWVASADYSNDVSISEEILDRASDAYRRIRNNFRFLLSNLNDFDGECDCVEWDEMPDVDKWAMARISQLLSNVTEAYGEFKFYVVYRMIYDYVGELSNVYLDMLKDRLYSAGAKSVERRSAQTVLANILEVLVRVWTPILSFTCDEVWDNYPAGLKKSYPESIWSAQLAGWPEAADFVPQIPADEAGQLLDRFKVVFAAREVVTKALEEARNNKVVGKSQEAAVLLKASAGTVEVLQACGATALEELFIVAEVTLEVTDGEPEAVVSVAAGEKCPRCWNIRELGGNSAHSDLCMRCATVVEALDD